MSERQPVDGDIHFNEEIGCASFRYHGVWVEIRSSIVDRCLAHIRSAPTCENAGDYVLEAIELAKELEGS